MKKEFASLEEIKFVNGIDLVLLNKKPAIKLYVQNYEQLNGDKSYETVYLFGMSKSLEETKKTIELLQQILRSENN